jgi:rare lipoprotein A
MFLFLAALPLSGQQTEGMASYYADRFHNLPTSTGETYDKQALTAASKEYPYGTILEVTEVVSGKKVKVRVNDCGPHHPDRIIDLSRAAATKIGLLRKGTARVRLRVVKSSDLGPTCERGAWVQTEGENEEGVTRVEVPTTAKGKPVKVKKKDFAPDAMLFGVQVGAFGNADNATAMVERLRAAGFTDAWSAKVGRINRVFTGKYYFQDEAEVLKRKVRQAGFNGAAVRRVQ